MRGGSRTPDGGQMKRIGLLASGLVALAAPLSAEPKNDIDLKLFERSEIDRSKGCSVALWQDDRDPGKDKYAYLFAETLSGKDHIRQPARIKIGTEVITLNRVATGGKTTGFGLYEYQLYRMPSENEFVVVNLKLAEKQSESVDVVSGVMIFIMKGKPVFRATVKGNAGCTTPVAPAPVANAPVRTAKAPASKPLTAMAACQAAAEQATDPTDFACNWKKAIAESPGFSLTGKFKMIEKNMSGEMTILETGLEPAQIGIATVAKTPNSPTCSAGLGASRDDKDQLTATMDEPKGCVVRIVSVPGPNIVKVTATKACDEFCGMGASFEGRWQLQTK
jgi:hypothetical protein